MVTSSSTYEEVFNIQFPYYLSIGMTPEQYWEGDATWAKSFLEAEKLRNDKRNQQAWLQGMYVYDAIGRLAPILRAMGKKGAKPQPYVEEPYPMSKEEVEDVQERKEREKFERGLRYMQTYASRNNKYYDKKEGK